MCSKSLVRLAHFRFDVAVLVVQFFRILVLRNTTAIGRLSLAENEMYPFCSGVTLPEAWWSGRPRENLNTRGRWCKSISGFFYSESPQQSHFQQLAVKSLRRTVSAEQVFYPERKSLDNVRDTSKAIYQSYECRKIASFTDGSDGTGWRWERSDVPRLTDSAKNKL